MGTEIFFTPPKTVPRDRRREAKERLEEFLKTFGNISNNDIKEIEPAPETEEQRLDNIKTEVLKVNKTVEDKSSFVKGAIPYRKVEDSCIKLQIRLDDLKIDDNAELRKQRRDALAKIEKVKAALYSKTK